MDLSSLSFVFFFLAVVLLVYYIVNNRHYRNVVLCLFSIVFCAWGDIAQCTVLIGTIVANYFLGRLLFKLEPSSKHRKLVFIVALALNILVLAVIKYTAFAVDNVKAVFPALGSVKTPSLIQPLGLSFYTFQNLSYIIDIYNSKVKAEKNIITYGTYLAMFPKLISGPIVRYSSVSDQMLLRQESVSLFASGVRLFVIGFARKMLIANPLAALWAQISADPAKAGVVGAWVGMIAFSLQLYFDFAGYSDMAIGVARMFGFRFEKNFNYPYISSSITEFWRRWHISLSTWFRDYVYIPLGGNRLGLSRQVLNILIVWALTGLWHGASWNFVLWGMFLGVVLILEKLFVLKALKAVPKAIRHVYTLLIAGFSWMLFSISSIKGIGAYFGAMFGSADAFLPHDTLVYACAYLPVLAVAAIASTGLLRRTYDFSMKHKWHKYAEIIVVLLLLLLCTASALGGAYQPVLYRQF